MDRVRVHQTELPWDFRARGGRRPPTRVSQRFRARPERDRDRDGQEWPLGLECSKDLSEKNLLDNRIPEFLGHAVKCQNK